MDYYAIGQRVRKARKARSLSQDELAEKVGISTTHMSHIETGNTKMSLEIFDRLAEALEVQADDLLHDVRLRSRAASVDRIGDLLSDCPTPHLKVIEDTIRAVKQSLKINIS